MTEKRFEELCGVCSAAESSAKCAFAEGAVGFIDTAGDGSRGIAFFGKKMALNFDGNIKYVAYQKIRSVQIINSLEDAFADELEIFGERSRLRISDYSLDKTKLKGLIEELRAVTEENGSLVFEEENVEEAAEEAAEKTAAVVRGENVEEAAEEAVEEAAAEVRGENVEEAAEEAVEETAAEVIKETVDEKTEEIEQDDREDDFPEELLFESEIPIIPEQPRVEEYTPQPIPNDKIEWLYGVIGTNKKTETAKKDEPPRVDEKTEKIEENDFDEDFDFIGEMSHEETLDFLSKALGDINSQDAPKSEAPIIEKTAELLPEEPVKKTSGGLTVEPMWGDIYIKASRSLRELCESGRISMSDIESELREKLLDSARAFSEVISNEQKIPKVLVPKIAELKNASENFDEYFSYGEDIGVRAMFFMLYQMLSYADRIAEAPDTKERLNDFFRRFGTAGITLSMLDVRG